MWSEVLKCCQVRYIFINYIIIIVSPNYPSIQVTQESFSHIGFRFFTCVHDKLCIPTNEVLGILWFREISAAAGAASAVDNRCGPDNLKSIIIMFIKLYMHFGSHGGITPIVIQVCTYRYYQLRGVNYQKYYNFAHNCKIYQNIYKS